MGRSKKLPTESVRISSHIMADVRKKSLETGTPLIRIIERAITHDLSQKPVTQEK